MTVSMPRSSGLNGSNGYPSIVKAERKWWRLRWFPWDFMADSAPGCRSANEWLSEPRALQQPVAEAGRGDAQSW